MSDLMQTSTASRLAIETHFPLQIRPAFGDPNQLELAVLNLVLNARDAMPDGGKIIISGKEQTVAAANALGLPAGDYVCIAVTDNGIGMDAETLARAVEPFFTTKGVGRGTGLGLSMVHGIAEQCGGKLKLMSEKAVGTTAEIWLPASEGTVVKEPPAQEREPTVFGEALTILVVDDDPLVLRNTAAMLEDLGHKPIEAGSAAKALQILRRPTMVDLVISDQVMPGMTGAELLCQIKQEWPALKSILATGYAELPPEVGTDLPRLAKPFQQSQLATAVAQTLSKEPSVVPFPRRRSSA
jgi:CheY-like chemotaxis protein